jgi:hypothetical protein
VLRLGVLVVVVHLLLCTFGPHLHDGLPYAQPGHASSQGHHHEDSCEGVAVQPATGSDLAVPHPLLAASVPPVGERPLPAGFGDARRPGAPAGAALLAVVCRVRV